MASGDIVVLSQDAGNGNLFTFTTTVDLAIMSWGFQSIGNLGYGTWVASTSGIGFFLRDPETQIASNGQSRPVIPSGSVITKNNVDVDVYGVIITCIEI